MFPKFKTSAVPAKPALVAEKDVKLGKKGRKSRNFMGSINETNESLSAIYPSGSIAWARIYRPDLLRTADEAERGINDTCHAKNLDGLLSALKRFKEAYNQIFDSYKAVTKIALP